MEEVFKEAHRKVDKIWKRNKRQYENNQLLMDSEFMNNGTRNSYEYINTQRDGNKSHTTLCRSQTISDSVNIKNNIFKNYWALTKNEVLILNANVALKKGKVDGECLGRGKYTSSM